MVDSLISKLADDYDPPLLGYISDEFFNQLLDETGYPHLKIKSKQQSIVQVASGYLHFLGVQMNNLGSVILRWHRSGG